MPESLETRLRQALDAEPHADPQRADEARAAALAALPHRPSRAPRSSRRRMVRVLVPLAAAACAAAGLIAIMPRGQKPAAPAGPAPEDVISLLRTGTPVDAATLHLPASGLGFPQVDMSSLRAVPGDPGGGDRILVARTTQGMACVVSVPPPSRPPAAGRALLRGTATPRPTGVNRAVASRMPGAYCYWPADLQRGAVVLRRNMAGVAPNRRTLVFVADGARVTTGTGAPAAGVDGTNLWALPAANESIDRIVLHRADGSRVDLALTPTISATGVGAFYAPLVLSPEDAARPTPVPDLRGLSPSEARRVTAAARLLSGRITATPAASQPGTTLDQSPASGTTAAADALVGVTRAAPLGPGGTRVPVDLRTRLALTGPRWSPPSTVTVGDLRGLVTVIRVVRNASDIRPSATYAVRPSNVFTLTATRGPAPRRSPVPDMPNQASAVMVDTDGALQRALGITALPATVVLDRNARVAYRAAGLPSDSDSALAGALDSLPYEDATRDALWPKAQRSAWFLRGAVATPQPGMVDVAGLRSSAPGNHVRTFGPSTTGSYVVAVSWPAGPGRWGVQFTATDGPSLGAGSGFSTGNDGAFRRLIRQYAVTVAQASVYGNGQTVYLVRPGYTRAIVNGRSIPIRNQVLTVRGRLPDGPVTLVGPQGKVPLDSTGVPR